LTKRIKIIDSLYTHEIITHTQHSSVVRMSVFSLLHPICS